MMILLVHFLITKYRSQNDFLCATNFGYVTMEFQVAMQDHWDKSALAYVAHVYGQQLTSGDDDEMLRDVVRKNILGDCSIPD